MYEKFLKISEKLISDAEFIQNARLTQTFCSSHVLLLRIESNIHKIYDLVYTVIEKRSFMACFINEFILHSILSWKSDTEFG